MRQAEGLQLGGIARGGLHQVRAVNGLSLEPHCILAPHRIEIGGADCQQAVFPSFYEEELPPRAVRSGSSSVLKDST